MIVRSYDILCFSEVLGHEQAKKIISRGIKAGRTPHAYLFRGPDGVGKKLFARGLAAALNCRSDAEGACGICTSCKKMLSDNHPDFKVVSPEKGAIKIDQVRKVSRELSYSPYESSVRVVVLEDVHMMRREAANSLLKTLEEPPENNLLILTAESSFEVLATISSRCQVIPFYGLGSLETEQLLEGGLDNVSTADRAIVARLAGGSPGKAIALAQSEVLSCWYDVRNLLLESEGDEDILNVLFCAEQITTLKDDVVLLFDLLKLWFRDHLLRGIDGVDVQLEVWDDKARSLSWSPERLEKALKAVEQSEKELFYNCNATLVNEVLLFTLLNSSLDN